MLNIRKKVLIRIFFADFNVFFVAFDPLKNLKKSM